MLLIWETGTLELLGVFEDVDGLSTTTVNLVALGLLGGAVAKSAQIPLHTWLPDAMEGPTPVSALIHAATMVTAGVYLLVRASPIFEAAPDVQHLAAILGAITLLVAGVVALVQWDIKRVIAYSTMSQIGYMFLAAGIGAYGYAIFHLMTHAFFKALLFMTAGLVIHHLGGEQDIRKMGGLTNGHAADAPRVPRRRALARGHPDLRRLLVEGRHRRGGVREWTTRSGTTLYAAGLVGALLTGLYTFRLYFAVFRGEPSEFVREHAHEGHGEGPLSMLIPVGVLTVLATIGGLVVIPGVWEPFLHWIDETAEPLVHATVTEDYGTSAIAVSLGLIGIFVARRAFEAGRQLVTSPGIWRVLEHKLYFDEAYDALFYRPAAALSVRASAERRGARRRALARRDRLRDDPGRRRGRARAVRPPPHLRASPSRSPSPSSSSSSWRCAEPCGPPPSSCSRSSARSSSRSSRCRASRPPVSPSSSRSWRSRSGSSRSAASTSTTAGSSSGRRASGSRASGSRTRSASTASRSGSSGATRRRLRRRDRLRALGRA